MWLRFDGQDYLDGDIKDFEDRLGRIYNRKVHQVQVLDFDVLTKEMDQAMTNRHRMEHTGVDGQVVFTSHAWRQLFGIRCPLVRELILDFFSTCREPLRRLCQRLIIFSIARRGQAPEKVTTTDLFYLRSMDEGTMVNVPYLVAYYLFKHASGRKEGAKMSGDSEELIRLQTCERLGDVLTWVALGPGRQ
ncbi:hypothetical protein Tco_1081101 [Tanacetum coccineum]|uniref:Uncharacterized protein n=1 Tax=Tanacetum coccineum TaxID=301880 RepID=A0ABQ5HWP5_9ASTR